MANLVVLVPAARSDVVLGSSAVAALGRLGVTGISVARDEDTLAVVLEGWAFDAARHDAVLAALGLASEDTRLLRPLAQMTVVAVGSDFVQEETP